jgi:hypothetical protein
VMGSSLAAVRVPVATHRRAVGKSRYRRARCFFPPEQYRCSSRRVPDSMAWYVLHNTLSGWHCIYCEAHPKATRDRYTATNMEEAITRDLHTYLDRRPRPAWSAPRAKNCWGRPATGCRGCVLPAPPGPDRLHADTMFGGGPAVARRQVSFITVGGNRTR